jgi:hypothetical protein
MKTSTVRIKPFVYPLVYLINSTIVVTFCSNETDFVLGLSRFAWRGETGFLFINGFALKYKS